MIAYLRGLVIEKTLNELVIDVNGIGYEVLISVNDADKIKLEQEIKLHIYHHIREQSQELFGFLEHPSKFLFKLLITVQSVGPKAALAILSLADFETIRSAIARGDAKFIQQAVGIGKKTAERIIIDLTDKVGVPSQMSTSPLQVNSDTTEDEAIETLMALGFNFQTALSMLDGVDSTLTTAERVKLALKNR